MSLSDRGRELIQRYFEDIASSPEIAELEGLLSTDSEVAGAFAEAARLEGLLKGHFQRQRKIDEVAALLQSADAAASAPGVSRGADASAADSGQTGPPAQFPLLSGSTFVRRYSEPTRPRRSPFARSLAGAARRWPWICAVLLVVAVSASVWLLWNPAGQSFRLISGRVIIANRAAKKVPKDVLFEVAGRDAAVFRFARSTRVELAPATRAIVRATGDSFVLKLDSGAAEISVAGDEPVLRIETALGVVTGTDCRFSIEIVSGVPGSSTLQVPVPRLVVMVARGSVNVERGGVLTTISAGEQEAFL